jgi:hypothetical protein
MGNKKNKTIIFCQASVDVCYTLQIIKEKGEENCIVFVINVENLYTFFKHLNLRAINIVYIPIPRLNLKLPYKTKNKINSIWKTFFQEYKDCTIYFFSLSYDYLTACMVMRLSLEKANKVYYYCYCKDFLYNSKKSFSAKRLLYSLVYRYITNGVQFVPNVKLGFPNLNILKYNIKKINVLDKPKIESKFLYKGEQTGDKCILFFISPEEEDLLTKASKIKLNRIVSNIKEKGYTLVLKGHPRAGIPKIINKFDKTIPVYIPSEFIDYNAFQYVIGFGSTALCFPAQHKLIMVISLLDMIEYRDKECQQRLKEYIVSYSGNTILFDFPPLV